MRKYISFGFVVILLGVLLCACDGVTSTPGAQSRFEDGFDALRKQDWRAAQTAFSAGLQMEPARSEALAGRGWANLELNEYDAAIADFDAALALNPQDASAWAGRGRARLKRGDDAAAIQDLSRAI